MKQLSLFAKTNDADQLLHTSSKSKLTLFIDGASRNNPGLSGAGLYVLKNEKPVAREGFFLGIKTNNQAEYLALLLGLFFLQKHAQEGDEVHIISDSQLLVQQIRGAYRVKNTALKPLFNLAKKMLAQHDYTVEHVLRAENKTADKLANKGIDKKIPAPSEFIEMLKRHELSL
jgi:ribonuclease HI